MQGKEYSLIIVDDEAAIRRGMCSYIDWGNMGFTVKADFEDGKETVEYLKTHSVDVVLTDIRMAEVDGLSVAKYIFDQGFPTRVVILSGYKEFEYAKQALQYNVVDYLLKPIHMDELERVFGNIREEFLRDEQREAADLTKRQDFAELLPELQEQFWMSILLGGIKSRDNIIRKRDLLSLHFSTRTPCAVFQVKLSLDHNAAQNYFLEKNNRYNLLNNIFAGRNEGIGFSPVYLSPEQLKMVATTEREMDLEDFSAALDQILKEKSGEISAILGLDMESCIEHIFTDITELTEYYYAQKIHVEGAGETGSRMNPEDYERLMQKYQLLTDTINAGDFASLEALMNNIVWELRSLPLFEVKELLRDMFSVLLQKFLKMSPELWRETKEHVDYSGILMAKDRGELKTACNGMMKQVLELIEKRQKEVSRNLIHRVTDYIQEHYCEDISLDMLAGRYYVNSSYLCRLFRQSTGETLTDYMIRLRMEKAKELLITGKYKVYEVSQKVGYRSDKYFFRVFKQYTGQSPTEYCRNRTDEKR